MCRVDNLDSFGKKNEMCGVLRVIKSFLRLWQLVTKISRFIEACWERWKINGGSSNWLERRWKGGGEERGCDQTTVDSTLVYIPTSPPRGETEENRNSVSERDGRARCCHVHAGSFYLAKLSRLVLGACQFVKAGFSRSYGIPRLNPARNIHLLSLSPPRIQFEP